MPSAGITRRKRIHGPFRLVECDGIFWTLKALEENARGGTQSKEENLVFLKTLGEQLSRARRHHEAYQALAAAFKLQPEPNIGQALNRLSHQIQPANRGTFWKRLWGLELDPLFYHLSAAALVLGLLFIGFNNSRSDSSSKRAHVRESTLARPPEPP